MSCHQYSCLMSKLRNGCVTVYKIRVKGYQVVKKGKGGQENSELKQCGILPTRNARSPLKLIAMGMDP